MKKQTGLLLSIVFCMASFIVFAASAAAAVDLPDKLKDIPIFPNAKIVQSMDMENHAMATFKVNGAKPEAVADFYKGKMKEKGWKVAIQAQQGDGEMVQFTKDGQMLQMYVQKEEDGATFNIVMTSKK